MLAHAEFWILEAAFRSLLMAVAVWAGIRMMRVEAVLAQKVAWVLVLLAAVAMPLVMRVPWLTLNSALRIPIRAPRQTSAPAAPSITAQASVSMPAAEPSTTVFVSDEAAPKVRHRVSHATAPHVIVLHAKSAKLAAKLPVSLKADTASAVTSVAPTVEMTASASDNKSRASFWAIWNWARIKPMLTALYLAIAGVLLLRTLAGLSLAFRIWRRSVPLPGFSSEVLSALGTQILKARVSPDLTTPVTIGSTILLPADYAEWDAAKLRVVLAHEHSHVRQGDFYLQSFAALHLALFWFSPLGWWLQRKISELGEALSDRAGLEQAKDPASYAQILLEFAAMPRTSPFAGALTGVAMARSSNLSSRIERILNARRFRLAFLDGRRHAVLAATLVPAALIATVACIQIVPAVEAAQAPVAPVAVQVTGVVAPAPAAVQVSGPIAVTAVAPVAVMVPPAAVQVSGQVSVVVPDVVVPDQVMVVDPMQAPPAAAPVAPAPSADVAPAQAPEPAAAPEAVPEPQEAPDVAPVPPRAPRAPRVARHSAVHVYSDDGDDSFAIIRGDNSTVNLNNDDGEELSKVRQKVHGNFIWFEHNGKSYVVTDPALMAQAESMFKGDEGLNRRMAELNLQQDQLNKKMESLNPEMENARLPGPEFEAQLKKLRAQIADLQSDKYKKIMDQASKEFSEEKLGELQEKIGDIQGQIGEIQGKIGERQGLIGEKQGELGEQMGRLGEEMGRIGEQQGRMAEQASRKLKSILDQAVKDGRAKPVD